MSLRDNQAENEKIIHEALEFGINYFDTADLYDKGMNEISIGKAFKGKRTSVVLATKVGNQWRKDGSGWDWNPRKEYILASVEESLKRLQTDYIDI
jgi:aryl-alcohol dehydrogenase-like predicted oxidoreductase